jgi:ketosteroid isomerase-like protein
MSEQVVVENEKAEVESTIRASIEWPFPEKNPDRLRGALARDASFFIFHPDSQSTIVGYEAFDKMIEEVFMLPACNPTSIEIRDMRINLSQSGDVAWYSCILDDYGDFDGRPWAWVNARWTGVLEKRDGKWLIVQMHFSFASDAKDESADSESSDGN